MRIYNRGKYLFLTGGVTWASHTIRALLVDSGYSYDPDDNFVSDVAGDELTDGSYARVTLTNKGATEDDTGDQAILTADPVDFGALNNETPAGMIFFREVTNDGDSPLLAFFDDDFVYAANGGGYVVNGEGAGDDEWIFGVDCLPESP